MHGGFWPGSQWLSLHTPSTPPPSEQRSPIFVQWLGGVPPPEDDERGQPVATMASVAANTRSLMPPGVAHPARVGQPRDVSGLAATPAPEIETNAHPVLQLDRAHQCLERLDAPARRRELDLTLQAIALPVERQRESLRPACHLELPLHAVAAVVAPLGLPLEAERTIGMQDLVPDVVEDLPLVAVVERAVVEPAVTHRAIDLEARDVEAGLDLLGVGPFDAEAADAQAEIMRDPAEQPLLEGIYFHAPLDDRRHDRPSIGTAAGTVQRDRLPTVTGPRAGPRDRGPLAASPRGPEASDYLVVMGRLDAINGGELA